MSDNDPEEHENSSPRDGLLRGHSSGGGPPEQAAFDLYISLGRASSDDVRQVLSALNEIDFAAGGMGFTFALEDDDPPSKRTRSSDHLPLS